MSYPIQKGVPVPPRQPRRHHGRRYPWDKMEVGDMFLVPFSDASYSAVASSTFTHSRATCREYAVRTLPNGTGVWRLA